MQFTSIGGNQQIITAPDGKRYFQSYSTIVAMVDAGGYVTLSSYWDYSRTTIKYLREFLCLTGGGFYESKQALETAIARGRLYVAGATSLTIE